MNTDHPSLSERELRSAMRLSITASCFGMVWVAAALGIPLVMFLQSIGASGVLIGFATTVQQLAMLAQIPASLFTERFSSRKKVWAWTAIVHRFLWFVLAGLPFLLPNDWPLMARVVVVTVALSALLGQAATPCWYSWMADLIPHQASAGFWSRRQSVVMAAYLVAMIGIGLVLDKFPDPRAPGGSLMGFVIVFAVAALCGVIDIVVHLGVPEPKARPPKPGTSILQRLVEPLRVRDFRWLSLALGTWTFGVGLVGSFGIIYLRRDFHFSYLELSSLSIAASIGAILAGFQSGYIIDRLGARTYGTVLLLIAPAAGVVWFFLQPTMLEFSLPVIGHVAISQPLFLQWLASVVAGAMYSSVGLCQLKLISALAPKEGRTLAMAVHWTVIGITGALGPLAGGAVMDWFQKHPVDWVMPTGTTFGFFHVLVLLQMAISWFIAVPMMLQVSLRKGDLPVGEALPRLWLGNPLRAVRNMYSIYAMTAAVSAPQRARAVSDLGASGTELAVNDLIHNLDDPAYDVREAAVRALGQLDSPEATIALIVKLESPDCDVAQPIARALRRAESPLALDALTRLLDSPDREVQFEAARSLAKRADRRAADPLVALLNKPVADKVFDAGAQALASLGDRRLIPLALTRLQTTRNRILRESLLLAIADVLGKPGEFYKLLSKEKRHRGTAIEILAAQIREQTPALAGFTAEYETAAEQANASRCAELVFQMVGHARSPSELLRLVESLRQTALTPDYADWQLLALYLLSQSRSPAAEL